MRMRLLVPLLIATIAGGTVAGLSLSHTISFGSTTPQLIFVDSQHFSAAAWMTGHSLTVEIVVKDHNSTDFVQNVACDTSAGSSCTPDIPTRWIPCGTAQCLDTVPGTYQATFSEPITPNQVSIHAWIGNPTTAGHTETLTVEVQ